jgi:hypothetical protein
MWLCIRGGKKWNLNTLLFLGFVPLSSLKLSEPWLDTNEILAELFSEFGANGELQLADFSRPPHSVTAGFGFMELRLWLLASSGLKPTIPAIEFWPVSVLASDYDSPDLQASGFSLGAFGFYLISYRYFFFNISLDRYSVVIFIITIT